MEQEQTPKQTKTNYFIPIAIVLAGVLIAGAVYLSGRGKEANQAASANLAAGTATASNVVFPPITSKDHILGSPNATVIMLEYSDTECPFCKAFYPTLQAIMQQYGPSGQVAWVYRHYPIAELHSKAPNEAAATECAADQGGNATFWKYLDAVYSTTTSNNTLDPAALPAIASELKLNVDQFNQCLSSGKYTGLVSQEVADAQKAGAQGTPYTILISKKQTVPITEGAISYTDLKSIIDQLITLNK
jgi:protein-disulfide isomerase